MTARGARQIGRLAVVICVVPMMAACTGLASSVRLPPKAAPTRAAAVARPRLLSSRQQVIAAFAGYTAAMAAAFDSRNAARVRQLLRLYLDRAAIDSAVRAFSSAWAMDEISYGHTVRHILSVKISGTAAWVHDCDDSSNSGLRYGKTGQVVPGSVGNTDDNVVTRLSRVRGHWQVYIQTVEDVPCEA